MTKAIMFQGTGSDVGKSVLVASFCRVLKRRGFKVLPFKPQNMSNNAAVTTDGGEIGRAQAMQALACGVEPSVKMNPVLLKPQTDIGAQVVVLGKVAGQGDSSYFLSNKEELLNTVIQSFNDLKNEADFVVVEGAGSPAEINLREGDIANMGFALKTQTPVILIGDIDKGGVIASVVGTHQVLEPDEQDLIKGFVINKFRGDLALFEDGVNAITERTSWASMGVLPFVSAVKQLPAEDAVVLDRPGEGFSRAIVIAVPMLSRISNFDDLDPLKLEDDVEVRFIPPGEALPGDADLILIPGTKATLSDLRFFREQGWHIDLSAHLRRGGHVLGVCGGFQLLGKTIEDLDGLEGVAGTYEGLGHLSVSTVMQPSKTVQNTLADSKLLNCQARGYEIHIGDTTGPDMDKTFLNVEGRALGAMSPNERVLGTYLHGLFTDDAFREKYLARFRNGDADKTAYAEKLENALDALADAMEEHLDIDQMIAAAQ